jgi:Domain of unknown function (DUF1707)/ABC transporter substrate-binding protein PnrA-like
VQDGFLGGYLAAGMSKTKTVATFGGERIAPVTIYMDGFWDGVQYYNAQHHTDITALGWNEKTQKGRFIGNFTSIGAGQTLTTTLIHHGADIIFPVAGGVGLGAAEAVQSADESGKSAAMEWSDTDGCLSAAQYCKPGLSPYGADGATLVIHHPAGRYPMAVGPGEDRADGSHLRASDTDREQVIEVLKAAFVQGRVTKDEFDLRVGLVLRSQTYAGLDSLTADIPARVADKTPAAAPVRSRDRAIMAASTFTILAWTLALFAGPFAAVPFVLGTGSALVSMFLLGRQIIGSRPVRSAPRAPELGV